MYFTYILFSEKLNKYYIGSSHDVEKRLVRHNRGHTTFTKTGIPWKIAYSEIIKELNLHQHYVKEKPPYKE